MNVSKQIKALCSITENMTVTCHLAILREQLVLSYAFCPILFLRERLHGSHDSVHPAAEPALPAPTVRTEIAFLMYAS